MMSAKQIIYGHEGSNQGILRHLRSLAEGFLHLQQDPGHVHRTLALIRAHLASDQLDLRGP